MKRQSGFTLVEIAIVLVVVGLLLAGIIQGTALINSGTAKNLANELKTMPVYVYQYQDKFRALPGDDKAAVDHVAGSAASGTKTGNGRIEGAWDSATSTDESFLVWEHIRKAGLAAGPTKFADATDKAAFEPRNVAGGRIGISSDSPFTGISGGFFACSGGILGKYVLQIDSTLDDGKPDSGSVQAAEAAAAETKIDETKTYKVCMAF